MKYCEGVKLGKRATVGILFLIGYISVLLVLMYLFVGYAQ